MSILQTDLTQRIRQAFEAARQARAASNIRGAIEHWERVIEWAEPSEEQEHLQAQMASCSECALAYQELGHGRRSYELLTRAVQLAEELVARAANQPANKAVEAHLALAGVRTNLSALLVSSREVGEGKQVAQAALKTLEAISEHPAKTMLQFAAKMQLGSASVLLGENQQGVALLQETVQEGLHIFEAGQKQVMPQLVEAVGRLYAGSKSLGQAEAMLPSVERVAQMATAAYEANGAPYLNIFIAAQMHRVNALLDLNRFADAEDQLWHTIGGSTQPNILMAAPDFYAALWQRDDQALERGGLPRAEVLESWTDAIAEAEKRIQDAQAITVMRQRLRLHTEGATKETQDFLSENAANPAQLSPLAVALLQALQSEAAQRKA